MRKEIVIPVRLDEGTYRAFCRFDTMVLRRRWFRPVLAGMLMLTLAMAGLLSDQPGLDSAAGVLAGLGLATPAMFFGLYSLQVRGQVAERGLKDAPRVYTVTLREDDVMIENDQKREPPVTLLWSALAAAYRVRGCIYLYVNRDHAFLLPSGQANASTEETWALLVTHLGVHRCFVREK